MTSELLERKKQIRKSIASLNAKCEEASRQTKRTLRKLDDSLIKEEFYQERQEFVSTTLQEFDNLDPSSLDVIFEYKCDDLMI